MKDIEKSESMNLDEIHRYELAVSYNKLCQLLDAVYDEEESQQVQDLAVEVEELKDDVENYEIENDKLRDEIKDLKSEIKELREAGKNVHNI